MHKQFISIFLFLSIITLAICSAIAYMQYTHLLGSYNKVIQSYQTIRAINQSLISIDEGSLSVSTFLQIRDSQTLNQIPKIIIAAKINFETLKLLVSDNRTQEDLVNKLTPLYERKLNFLTKIINEYSAGDIQQALQISSDKNRMILTNQITQLLVAIKQEEVRQLNVSNIDLNTFKAKSFALIYFFGILSGLLFLISFVLLNSYFKKY